MKFIYFINTTLITYFIILTNSRNALIGLIISLMIIFGFKGFVLSTYIALSVFFIFSILYFQNNLIFNELLNKFLSNPIITKLSNFGISDFAESPRLEILNITFNLIFRNPIWGYGSGTFQVNYGLEGGIYNAQHTHNIFLQIAYDYGLPSAIIIFFVVACESNTPMHHDYLYLFALFIRH